MKITFWLEYATPSFIHSTVGVGTPEALQVSEAFSPSFTTTSGIGEICERTAMVLKLEFFKGSTDVAVKSSDDSEWLLLRLISVEIFKRNATIYISQGIY